MTFKPTVLLLPLLGIALGIVSPWSRPDIVNVRHSRAHGHAAPEVNPYGAWGDARTLTQRMAEACEWAKAATRTDFVERPKAIASDVDTVAGFLKEDYAAAFTKMGAGSEEAVSALAHTAASQLLAAYDPKTNTVHVLPDVADAAAKRLGREGMLTEGLLRLLLVRMAVIGLDRQIFPEWKTALDTASSLDALDVAGAVLQGHAQYVAKRVIGQWNKNKQVPLSTFDDLVALLTCKPADTSPAAMRFHESVKFAVLQGHEFMALAARKPRPGIAKLLQSPPEKRGAVLDPIGYFDTLMGKVSSSNLPGKVRESFHKTLWKDDGWTFEEVVLAAKDTEALLAPLEKMAFSTVMAGFLHGKQFNAVKDGVVHQVVVLEFRSPGLAEGFVNTRKGAVERGGGSVEAGAGRDGGLNGFTGSQGEGDAKRWMQWTYEGSYALGFLTPTDISSYSAREPWDDAVEAAAETIAKAEKTRENKRRNRK